MPRDLLSPAARRNNRNPILRPILHPLSMRGSERADETRPGKATDQDTGDFRRL